MNKRVAKKHNGNIQWTNMKNVADYLNLSYETLYKMTRRCEIPCYKVGSRYFYDLLEIDNWIKRSKKMKLKPEGVKNEKDTSVITNSPAV